MKRLIIFLIRLKLGLRKYERFQFGTQTDKTVWYYFTEYRLVKEYADGHCKTSGASLNWLLNKKCAAEIHYKEV